MIGILNVIKDFNFNCRNSCLLAFYTHKLFVNRTSWPYDWHPGPPRGSVGHGAKYLFGGPDDVIMYSNGTRVYWKRGRILRSSALKSSDCIFRGAPGPFPRNIFEFRVSEIAFPAFCEHFWAKSNDLIKSRFLRGPSQVGGQGNLAPPPRQPHLSVALLTSSQFAHIWVRLVGRAPAIFFGEILFSIFSGNKM